MNIKIYNSESNYHNSQTLYIDGKREVHVSDLSESPEDAIIGRSLVDCYDILTYMKLAYEAGKVGESLEVHYIDGEEE